ncbi:MAG: hypothetical protein ACOYL6_11135 [Bacteriovoracaceae bacterium]
MRRILITIGFLIIIAIFIFSLIKGAKGEGLFPHSDKVGHCLAYFSVTYWFLNLYPRKKHFILMIVFTFQGIIIEFLQRETGYRSFDYFDMLANFSGSLLAYILASKYCKLFKVLLDHCSPSTNDD